MNKFLSLSTLAATALLVAGQASACPRSYCGGTGTLNGTALNGLQAAPTAAYERYRACEHPCGIVFNGTQRDGMTSAWRNAYYVPAPKNPEWSALRTSRLAVRIAPAI